MERNCFDITAINEKEDVQMKTKMENIKVELEGFGFNVDIYECGEYRNAELKGKYNTEIDLPKEYLAIIIKREG